jgi:lysozyme family protein
MDNFDIGMIEWLIRDIEGDVADLSQDRGGWTYKGLSSRYFPEIKTMYENGTLTDSHVYRVYYTEYIANIPLYKELKDQVPWLVKLIFPAKVHGSGDEDLAIATQSFLRTSTLFPVKVDGIFGRKTAQAVLSLNKQELQRLELHILDSRDTLVAKRIASVGAYPDGIRNRVLKEFSFAFNGAVDFIGREPTSSDAVAAYAKLSSVSAGAGKPASVQVVDAHGWEQLPLGMDITIEIRGTQHASNPIVSSSGVRQT